MSEEKSGLHVPARVIPVPKSISPEAQAFLSHSPPVGGEEALPALDDIAGWKAHAAKADASVLAIQQGYRTLYPAEVATHQLAHCPLYEVTPESLAPENASRAILYIHGGGFFMGGGEAAILSAQSMAGQARCRTFSLDYRMPPEHRFPAAIEDGVDAWRWLIERYRPENMAVYGPSAGGNLAPALILKLRDLGLPLPAVCAVHSPASDLTESGDSYATNETIDIVLRHRMPQLRGLYAGDHDLRDPLVSPAFADYSGGFPPTILTTGTRDLLLSSTVLLHRAMRRGGVEAELHVWEAMTHAPFFGSPEERELMDETIRFMLGHMGSD
jgi:acetyl esterase/lipase